MDEHSDLTISAAAIQMRQGELTAQALIESCLERIHTRENIIHAWVEVYEKTALEEARRCDQEARMGKWRGDLHGGWFEYMILTGGIGCDLVVDHGQAEAIVLGARMFRKRGRFVVGAAYASSTASKIDFGAICNQNELTFIGRTMLGHDCRNK